MLKDTTRPGSFTNRRSSGFWNCPRVPRSYIRTMPTELRDAERLDPNEAAEILIDERPPAEKVTIRDALRAMDHAVMAIFELAFSLESLTDAIGRFKTGHPANCESTRRPVSESMMSCRVPLHKVSGSLVEQVLILQAVSYATRTPPGPPASGTASLRRAARYDSLDI